MDITARINNHEKKRSQNNTDSLTASILSAKPPQPENAPLQSPAQPPQPVSPPSPSQEIIQAANTDDIRNVKIDIPGTPQNNGSADWRSLDYDSAVKFNPDLSVSQYISGASQYRKENNQPGFSDMELYALLGGGKDPYKSKKELDEEAKQRNEDDKRLRTGYYVDSIGNLLANLINYTRTTKGNPAMDLRGLGMNRGRLDNERNRLQQLRIYHDNLARSNYKDYMDMLKEKRAREAAVAAAEVEFQQKLLLEQMKQNSPLTKLKEESERARKKGLDANRDLAAAKAEAQRKENESQDELTRLEADLLKARAFAARNSAGGSRGKKQPLMARLKNNDSYSKDEYNLNDDKDLMKMYRQGVELGIFPEYKEADENGNLTRIDPSKMNPDKLRNIILYSGNYVTEDDEDYDRVLSYPRKKPSLGWGVSSKNDKDEDQLDW